MSSRNKSIATGSLDPTIDWVTVSLNGRNFKLCFDFNSLALCESLVGIDMLKAVRFENMTAIQYRALFYCALLKAQPTMTLEQAGDLCTMGNLKKITDAILQTYGMSMPVAKDDVEVETKTTDQSLPTENSGSDVSSQPVTTSA